MRTWWRRSSREPREPDGPDSVVVWNRACDCDFEPRRRGDRALKAAILLDGLTSNGGLDLAFEGMSEDERQQAIVALRYFGLADAARLVEEAFAMTDEEAREA